MTPSEYLTMKGYQLVPFMALAYFLRVRSLKEGCGGDAAAAAQVQRDFGYMFDPAKVDRALTGHDISIANDQAAGLYDMVRCGALHRFVHQNYYGSPVLVKTEAAICALLGKSSIEEARRDTGYPILMAVTYHIDSLVACGLTVSDDTKPATHLATS